MQSESKYCIVNNSLVSTTDIKANEKIAVIAICFNDIFDQIKNETVTEAGKQLKENKNSNCKIIKDQSYMWIQSKCNIAKDTELTVSKIQF